LHLSRPFGAHKGKVENHMTTFVAHVEDEIKSIARLGPIAWQNSGIFHFNYGSRDYQGLISYVARFEMN